MNHDRLNHLKTVMLEVAASQAPFNIMAWAQHVSDPDFAEYEDQFVGNIDPHGCGSVRCALGYAALDPQFRAEGLSMLALVGVKAATIESTEHFDSIYKKSPVGHVFIVFRQPPDDSIVAAAEFFGISEMEAECVAEWMVQPFTVPGGLLVDPFSGSGAIIRAGERAGMRAVGFEKNPPLAEVA